MKAPTGQRAPLRHFDGDEAKALAFVKEKLASDPLKGPVFFKAHWGISQQWLDKWVSEGHIRFSTKEASQERHARRKAKFNNQMFPKTPALPEKLFPRYMKCCFPRYMKCCLCEQRILYSNPKAFSSAMRRHRKAKHPDHVGRIHYTRIEDQ